MCAQTKTCNATVRVGCTAPCVRYIIQILHVIHLLAGTSNCWVHYARVNSKYGRFPVPGQGNQHNTWFFTDASDRQACVIACDVESRCDSYTWVDPDVGGGWGGCYGVSEDLITHVSQPGSYSGKTVPC